MVRDAPPVPMLSHQSGVGVAGLRRSAHITDTLASFHWLRAHERIKFKLAVILYRALYGNAPRYLSDG